MYVLVFSSINNASIGKDEIVLKTPKHAEEQATLPVPIISELGQPFRSDKASSLGR